MDINNDAIKSFSEKFYFIINIILPGMFCMDIIFKYGLISNNIDNVYKLILLLCWSILLSAPFGLILSDRIDSFIENLISKQLIKEGVNKDEIDDKVNMIIEEDPSLERLNEAFELYYNIFRLPILYIIFKFLVFLYKWIGIEFLLFNKTILIFLLSISVLVAVEPVLSRIFLLPFGRMVNEHVVDR